MAKPTGWALTVAQRLLSDKGFLKSHLKAAQVYDTARAIDQPNRICLQPWLLEPRLFCWGTMAGTISALVVQKKNKDRVNVYLDGRFAFGLAAIEALRLKRGQALSDEEIAALQTRDELEWARQQALGLLERRPRSVEEVRRYLNGKGYPPDMVEQVVERLAGAGLLDDRAFARFWLENRDAFRPRGARALRYELRQKGVPDELIAELLEGGHDEEAAAYQAALPKARRWRHLEEREFHTKLQGFLARRGFSYDVARDTSLRAWQAIHADAPDQVLED